MVPVSLRLHGHGNTKPRPFIHQYTPRIASLLNPAFSSQRSHSPASAAAQQSRSRGERPLRTEVLKRGVSVRGRPESITRPFHPRYATALGQKRKERLYRPYSHDNQKRTPTNAHPPSSASQDQPPATDAITRPLAARFDNTPSRPRLPRPLLLYLPRDAQETRLRGALRHLMRSLTPASGPSRSPEHGEPETRSSAPPTQPLASVESPDSPSIEASGDTVPPSPNAAPAPAADALLDAVSLTGPGDSAVGPASVAAESDVEPVSAPSALQSSSASNERDDEDELEVELAEGHMVAGDEGTDVEYDEPEPELKPEPERAQIKFSAAAVPRTSSSVRDEGYQGSETSESAEIDELEGEEGEADTHQVPAYRQRPVASNQPLSLTLPTLPQSLFHALPKSPHDVAFLPPSKRKHEIIETPTGGPLKKPRPNWARTERKLPPAPEPREGWDKSKRASKNVERSRAFYNDPAAKAVPPPAVPGSLKRKQFQEWMDAIKAWFAAGEAMQNGDHPIADTRIACLRSYQRATKAALKADDGFVCGVRSAKPAFLSELGFPPFLQWAKGRAVDARWGKEAIELKENMEKYWAVLGGKMGR